MPLNRVSFYGKNYATGCPFLIKLSDRLLQLIRKLCDRVSRGRMPFRVLLKQWILAKFYVTGYILLGHTLYDRVQGVERFAAHPRHFTSQVPPPQIETQKENKKKVVETRSVTKYDEISFIKMLVLPKARVWVPFFSLFISMICRKLSKIQLFPCMLMTQVCATSLRT